MYNYLILNTLCTNHLTKRFNRSPKAFLKNIRNKRITIRMGEDIISQNRSSISTIKSITESVDGGQFLNIRFFIFFNIFITFIDQLLFPAGQSAFFWSFFTDLNLFYYLYELRYLLYYQRLFPLLSPFYYQPPSYCNYHLL